MNDLPDGLTSLCKIFADDTFLFSKVFNINESEADGPINGKCNSILIPTNKQMVFFHGNQMLVT